jgi:tetratricopeptide (TPR) repeat protein
VRRRSQGTPGRRPRPARLQQLPPAPAAAALTASLTRGRRPIAGRNIREAEKEYREAVRLNPQDEWAHFNLGNTLRDQGKLPEAEAAYRAAIRLNPDNAGAHCNLGLVLRSQGKFAASLAALRRGHALSERTPGRRYPTAQWVREGEALPERAVPLPAVLAGQAKPVAADERLGLAESSAGCRSRAATPRPPGCTPPLRDLACFPCQQAAEKYLKALLQELGAVVPKTHDLEELLDLVLPP